MLNSNIKCPLRAVASIYLLSVTENKRGTNFWSLKHHCKSLEDAVLLPVHLQVSKEESSLPLLSAWYVKLEVSSALRQRNSLFTSCLFLKRKEEKSVGELGIKVHLERKLAIVGVGESHICCPATLDDEMVS